MTKYNDKTERTLSAVDFKKESSRGTMINDFIKYGMEEAADELMKVPRDILNSCRASCPGDKLIRFFAWENSPQKHDFWAAKHRLLKQRINKQTENKNEITSKSSRETMINDFIKYGMEETAEVMRGVSLDLIDPVCTAVDPADRLRKLFVWSKSVQGGSFWQRQHVKLCLRIDQEQGQREEKRCETCLYKNRSIACYPCNRCNRCIVDCRLFPYWVSAAESKTSQTSGEKPNIQTYDIPKKPEIKVPEIIVEWLEENGYDGLIHDDAECACFTDQIMDCPEGFLLCNVCTAAQATGNKEVVKEARARGESAINLLEPADPWTWRCDRCKLELTVHWHPDWFWEEREQCWKHRCLGDEWNFAFPVWEKDFS